MRKTLFSSCGVYWIGSQFWVTCNAVDEYGLRFHIGYVAVPAEDHARLGSVVADTLKSVPAALVGDAPDSTSLLLNATGLPTVADLYDAARYVAVDFDDSVGFTVVPHRRRGEGFTPLRDDPKLAEETDVDAAQLGATIAKGLSIAAGLAPIK